MSAECLKRLHAEARKASKPLIARIIERGGRCMKQVIDREFGIFFERWRYGGPFMSAIGITDTSA